MIKKVLKLVLVSVLFFQVSETKSQETLLGESVKGTNSDGAMKAWRSLITGTGSSFKGVIDSRIGESVHYSSYGHGVAIAGHVNKLTTLKTDRSWHAKAVGGNFSVSLENANIKAGQYDAIVAGSASTISGSISSTSGPVYISAVYGQDQINRNNSYAGYFDGKVFIRGNVGVGTSTPAAKFNLVQDGGNWDDGLRFNLADHSWDIVADNNGERLLISRDQVSSSGISIWNGNIGIGTGGPLSKLNIMQDGGAWNDGLRFNLADHSWDIVSDNNGERLLISRDQVTSSGISIWNGNVGIGTGSPTAKLTVAGNIECRRVEVTINAGADFVFEEGYQLRDIDEVEAFVKENKHLPEIAPAAQMEAEGVDLSEMNIKLLQKIEELTLYLIEQNKVLEEQGKALVDQSSKIIELEKEVKELKHKN